MAITTVGLDADDTLWHNETLFRLTQDRFFSLLADVAERADLEARLAEVEKRNLRLYGYGVKGFTLSMIETAMELTGGEAPSRVIRVAVEIVSEKEAGTYRRVFDRHGTGPAEAVMCGNSVRSDILPAIEAGAYGAHVPYPLTWAHEVAEPPLDHPRFRELASIRDLPGWVASL